MLDEKITLAFFVKFENIVEFLNYIEITYKIYVDKVKIYKIENNNKEYFIVINFSKYEKFLITDKMNYLKLIHVHIKSNCIYSINALNKYIELNNNNIQKGNFDYKSIKIDWEKLNNKLLLIKNNKLKIENLIKIINKNIY